MSSPPTASAASESRDEKATLIRNRCAVPGNGAARAGGSLKTDVWVDMCTSKDGTAKKNCVHVLYAWLIRRFNPLVREFQGPDQNLCARERSFVSAKQMVDIGLEYVRRHPDSNSRPIAVVLREAIEEAFPQPCKEM